MNILRHMEQIRRLLTERGACEVPQYPEPLAQVWYHPDILLAARGDVSAHCFCFQTLLQQGTGAAATGVSCAPALVWLMNCSEKDFSITAVDFISDLHFALTSSRENSGFSLIACGDHVCCSDRGCCWKLQYNGVSCGQISLFSELFFQPLSRPVVMLVLDLAKLPALLNQKGPGQPVLWAEKAAAADLLALRAWQLRCSAGSSRDLLQQRQADSGLELCRLISLLNSESMEETQDDAQLKKLSASIIDTVQLLLNERSTSKVATRDVGK